MSEPSKKEQFQDDVLDYQDDSDHFFDEEKGNKGILMNSAKGPSSMWNLTPEENEDVIDFDNFEESIEALLIRAFASLAKKEVTNQFAQWFQESTWDEVREVLFSNVQGYDTSLPQDWQLSDEELKELLKVKDWDGDNLLQVALYKGAPKDIILRLVDVGGKEVLKDSNRSGQTSLHYACRYNADLEIVQKLLDGMDKNFIFKKDEDKMNALHHACSYLAHVDIIELLLEKAGSGLISVVDENGFTTLHFACRAGADENVVQLLLEKGPADLVFMKTKENWSALHHACANNASANVVKTLVKKGGIKLIEMKNDENYTCLYYTCLTNDDSEVLITLLDSLGEEKIQSDEVINALFVACARGAPAQMIRPFFKGKGINNLSHRRANNQSILHVACSTKEVKIDTIQELTKFGGKRLINYQDGSGENVLHYCVKAGVSDEIVEALIDAAGDYTGNFIRCRDHHECNALHCVRSVTPLEVIDRLVQGENALLYFQPDDSLCFQADGDGDLPLDKMIRRTSDFPEKQILHVQDIMYNKSRGVKALPFRTLNNIRSLPGNEQGLISRGKYIRSALNHLSITPMAIYPMILDIVFQLLSIWIFSFQSSGNILNIKTEVKQLSYVCFAWILLRARASLVNLMQLFTFGTFIFSIHAEFSKESFVLLLICCIGVTWFRFIYICSIVNYKAKVFISALELITRSLFPFLIVTAFIVMAFAHMFHAAGPPSGINCPASTMEYLENSEYESGGWTCELNDSYFQSFAMLLSGDFLFFERPNGKWSILTFLFAIVIGIVMLNVLIAVVNDSLMENQRRSQDEFWLGRLDFLCSINDILRFLKLSSLFERAFTGDTLRRQKPSRRAFSDVDKRDIEEWRGFKDSYELLHWFETGHSSSSKDLVDRLKESSIKKDHMSCRLTLWQRIRAFLEVASWNELIPSSKGMVKVFGGVHRAEELKGRPKWRAFILSWLFFIGLVLFSPLAFIAGILSAGKTWPYELKAFIFFGPIEVEVVGKESEEKENGSDYITASDLKFVVERINEQQKEMRDKVDEINRNQAELLKLLHEIKKGAVDC